MPENVQQIMSKLLAEHLSAENDARIATQEKLYYYYQGDSPRIKEYLNTALAITYDVEEIAEMQLQFINLTKKVVDQLAVIYKSKPERYLVDENGNKKDDATEYYDSILPNNLSTKDKTAHRYARLFDTSLTQVYFDFDAGTFQYRVHPSQNINVIVDDEDTQKIKALSYDKYYNDKLYTVIWTAENHYKVDQDGNPVYVKDNKKGVNPFGVIPFARFIRGQNESIWGEGLTDAVNINEQINFLLTKLINRDIIIGSEGTVVATNCGFKTKGNKADESEGIKKPRIGVKHPIVVEGVRSDMVPPSVTHTSFTPLITEIKDTIDWYVKLLALTKGLNPNSFLAEVQATSGYSKIVDSLEQLEFREDDLEPARIYEQERFEITRKMNNYYATTKEGQEAGLKPIDENLYLVVDFAEIEIQRTPQEIREDRQFELENNLSTPAKWLMEDNADLSQEDAEKQIEENKKYNESLTKQKTIIEKYLNRNNEGNNVKQQ